MKSIRRSIVVSLSVAVLLVCGITFASVLAVVQHQLIAQFDDALRTRAEAIAALVQIDRRGRIVLDASDEGLVDFFKRSKPAYFQVSDRDGRTLLRSNSMAGLSLMLGQGDRSEGTTRREIMLPDGRLGRVATVHSVPSRDEDQDAEDRPATTTNPHGTPVWVSVAAETRGVTSTLHILAGAFVAAFALVVVALLLIVPRFVRAGLRPLEAMSARAAQIDAASLSTRFATDAMPTELSPIVTQLNLSLARIGEAFERERRFAANAAHELRTPLAAIRTNVEVALKWPEPEQVNSAMGAVLRSAERMQGLVERLLELARLGREREVLPLAEVDLAPLLEESLREAAPQFAARKLTITSTNTFSRLIVRSHDGLLPSLIDNVIANAARHATPGTEVAIAVAASPDGQQRIELVVANVAVDLEPADLALMFDPLWTKSSDRSAGSAGLGLALVAEYARLLDILLRPSFEAESRRFKLTLSLPASAERPQ